MNNKLRNLVIAVIVCLFHVWLGLVLFWRPSAKPATNTPEAPQTAQTTAPDAPEPTKSSVANTPPSSLDNAQAQASQQSSQPAPVPTPMPADRPMRPAPQVPAASAFPPYRNGFYRMGLQPMSDKLRKSLADVRSGVVIDVATRTILWEKNSAVIYPIASLTKLLTAQMLIEKIAATPDVTMQSVHKITRDEEKYLRTKRITGVYLDSRDTLTFSEYVKCMIISSANDCAAMAGKYIGNGSLEDGVAAMNARAKQLGLNGMLFYNPNGLPIDRNGTRVENMGSALHVAYLSERSLGFPEIMKWAGVASDCIRENTKRFDLHSTNKLLRARVPGVNGLKTGYTATAGYCISVTCTRNNRTVIIVLMGVPGSDTGKHRDAMAKSLLEWVYG